MNEVTLQDVLDARERRAWAQERLRSQFGRPLLSFTMNIPGPVKDSPLIRRGFDRGASLLEKAMADAAMPLLAREEQREKQNLVQVSGNFNQYSEERIRATYEKVKDVQVALGVEREKEADLRERRDKLELRLRKLGVMLDQAEHLALAVGSVFSYLSSQVSGVMWKIEAVQKEQFVGARVIKAQEEERYRMSREIHDGPAQDMANMLIQTSIVEKLMDKDMEEAKRTLRELRSQIKECLGSVRQIIFDMRPMALDDLGLVPALRHHSTNSCRPTSFVSVVDQAMSRRAGRVSRGPMLSSQLKPETKLPPG